MGIYDLRILLCGIFLFLLTAVTPVYAQDGEVTDDEVNNVAKKLYCPTCESVPVDVCPTQACSDWRALIREQLEDGRSEQEILDYFEDRFGPQALVNPPRRGIGLVVWIAPAALVLIGLIFFGRYFVGLGKKDAEIASAQKVAAAESPTDAYRAQLERELNQE